MSTNYTNETVYVPPGHRQGNGCGNTAGTVFVPEGGDVHTAGTVYLPEQDGAVPDRGPRELLSAGTNVQGYLILETVSTRGRESVVYRAMKGGEDFALKLYKRELELNEAKMRILTQLQCPYIAKLQGYGTYQGQPFEVYPYYKNGTLENRGKVEGKLLKRYVSQLNEALHCLHTAQGAVGMVHGDLKPSNIFVSDDGESLLLGDFGVSNIRTASGTRFAQICGTPEFAPPSTGVMDRMKKGPAFDYGALGLVVYHMATGYSYFAGCTPEEIAEGWERGIRIPEELDTRVKMLLKGLLQFEEDRRFGYEEVHDWYRGSFVQAVVPKKIFARKPANGEASLWFGFFDGQVVDVTSVEELVGQMRLHWDQAVIKLRDTNLYDFLDAFYPDGSISEKIRGFVEEGDDDSAVFKTIYTLSDNGLIVYKGKHYGDASGLIEAMVAQDPNARELISKGLFLFYAQIMGYPPETFRAMQEVLEMKHCPEDFKMRAVGYMFAGDKRYNGWQNMDDLRAAVCNMTLDQIDELVVRTDFLAWLYVMGLKDQALSMIALREEDK